MRTGLLILKMTFVGLCLTCTHPPVEKEEEERPSIRWDELIDPLAMHKPDLKSFLKRLQNSKPYHDGVYGKIDGAVYFGASTKKVPNWSMLYRVMVNVLSEKFGCFMQRRQDRGNRIAFSCRDGRSVVFWRAKKKNWIEFYAKQYDREGNELIVQNGVVVDVR